MLPQWMYVWLAAMLVLLILWVEADAIEEWAADRHSDPKCDTHGHDEAIVDSFDRLRERKQKYTVELRQHNNVQAVEGWVVVEFDGRVVETVEVKECRFCDRRKEVPSVDWWLPDDGYGTPNDEPVRDLKEFSKECALDGKPDSCHVVSVSEGDHSPDRRRL